MSDENRPDDEIEAHDPVGLEQPGPAAPEMEATGDEEPDVGVRRPCGERDLGGQDDDDLLSAAGSGRSP